MSTERDESEMPVASDPGGGRALCPLLGGIGDGLGRKPSPRPSPATQPRDTRDALALADVAAMDESARAYYANLGKIAVDRIEEALDDGLLVANVAYLIPDGLDALIALARRNRGGGTGADSASSLFARHQKAALDLYDAIYRQAEAVVGAVDGGPLAQVEALANEIRGLRASRDEAVNLLMEWAYDRGVILHLGKDYDSRDKFRELIGQHGIKVHRHERTCFDDSGPEGTGVVVVCGRAEGVESPG
jgi:hypothetical protein